MSKNNIFDSSLCLTLDQLDAYIESKLSEHKRFEVEKHLVDCALCSDALEGMASSPDKGKVEQIIKSINKGIRDNFTLRPEKKPHRKVYYATAVALLVAIISFLYVLNNRPPSTTVYAKFFKPYPNTIPLTRGDESDSPVKSAMIEYEAGNYKGTLKILQAILDTEPDNIMAYFYSGIANLCLEHPKQAIFYFQKVIDGQDDFIEQSEWYLSLAYLKNKDMEKSKTILKKIIADGNNYNEQSKSLLDSLN